MAKTPKRSRDPNEPAKLVADTATGEAEDENPNYGKNPAAVALGRLGGLKGGRARAKKLTKKQRQDIARAAAQARWRGSNDGDNQS